MSDGNDPSERLYEGVLRQVLWGDGRDEIMRWLEVNSVSGEAADSLFQRAMAERVSTIRGFYRRRVVIGGLILVIGLALFAVMAFITEGFRVVNLWTTLVPTGVTTLGAWKFLGGVIGVVTASSRNGPISEID